MESERTEEYLEAIYKRQGKGVPVTTSSLASDLGVSQPAVTDMLRTLQSKGLINYRANKGAVLTQAGKEGAIAVVRRHRLWERFLTDVLGMKWDKVHKEACRLEHATSPDIEKGLSNLLGNVNTCPHGHSIPDERGNMQIRKAALISQLQPSQKIRILSIDDEKSSLLRDMEKLGLRPGTIATILKRNDDGSFDIQHDGRKITLDKETAAVIRAEIVAGKDPASEELDFPLGKLLPGESAVIKAYGGGRGSLGRCLSLGFTPGSEIKMMENYRRGPVLVKIHDTEVAVGRQLAEKIYVVKKE